MGNSKEDNDEIIKVSNFSTTSIDHGNIIDTEIQYIFTTIMFLTRIPIPLKYQRINIHPKYVMTGVCYFPLVGCIIGILSSTLYEISFNILFIPNEICCVLSMIFHFCLCNCFHEDGLADTFDGMGGGWTKDQILTIMSDSRIGTYGSVSLITYIITKLYLLILLGSASLSNNNSTDSVIGVGQAIILSQTFARLTAPILIYKKQYVKESGMKTSTAYYHYMMNASKYNTLDRVCYSAIISFIIGGYRSLEKNNNDAYFIMLLLLVVYCLCYIAGLYGDLRLGGIMGDYLGCIISVTELIILLMILMKQNIIHMLLKCYNNSTFIYTVMQEDINITIMLHNNKLFIRCSIILLFTILWFNYVGYNSESSINRSTNNDNKNDDELLQNEEQNDEEEKEKSSLHPNENNFQTRYKIAKEYIDSLAKPPGSLGTLEDWGARVAAIQGTMKPKINNVLCLIFAADHGIASSIEDGGCECSSYPQSITKSILHCFENNIAASSILCSNDDNITLRVIDVGVKDYNSSQKNKNNNFVISAKNKLTNGTNNYCNYVNDKKTYAMSIEDVHTCYSIGRDYVQKFIQENNDVNVIIFGEVGIGNTTTSSVLLSFLTNTIDYDDICKLCGPGATTPSDEINTSTIQKKIKLVQEAISIHYETKSENDDDEQYVWNILQKVGGAEIVSIIGGIIEASKQKLCILLDGYIVTIAALAAIKLKPDIVSPYLFLTTKSNEPGHMLAIQCIQDIVEQNGYPSLNGCNGVGGGPVLDMGLRLGEGSGAILALPLLRSSVLVFHGMATLEQVLSCNNDENDE